MASRRYARTERGHEEIALARKTLRGKLRTVLFLVDPGKSAEDIQGQVEQIGAPADALAQLAAGGYIVEVEAGIGTAARPGPSIAAAAPAPVAPSGLDEAESFRLAKAFMNDNIVDALGIRAFLLTLRLERCATRADLAALLPDYVEALQKKLDRNVVRALAERTRELIGPDRS